MFLFYKQNKSHNKINYGLSFIFVLINRNKIFIEINKYEDHLDNKFIVQPVISIDADGLIEIALHD